MGNTFKTAFLLTAMTLLLMLIGRAFGGQNGMFLALAFATVMNFVSYFYSDKIALAMYRAQPVTREELPRAYSAVERLTQKIGIPMPKIYVIPNESPNAFATGRNPSHASVAVTHGILGLLNDEELEGVLRPRTGPCQQPRHPDQFRRRYARRRHHDDRQHGSLGDDVRRLQRPRPRPQRRRRPDRPLHADRRPDRCQLDSARRLALARISSRCDWRAFHRQSLCARQRPAEARRLLAPRAYASKPLDRAPVHHSAIVGNELRQPVLDSSPNRKTHRAPDGKARGVYAVTLSAVSCQ